jgi:Tol biopolymer transport system component
VVPKKSEGENFRSNGQRPFSSFCQTYITLLILLAIVMGCDVKPAERPLSLGSFTEISKPSISPDGNQILFTGCGHREYPQCTIYRFERGSNKLYRYIPQSETYELYGGRFSPVSNKIALSIIPTDSKHEKVYEDTQIAVMDQDGTSLKVVTSGKGVKLSPALAFDEKNIVFSKGRMSNSGSPLRKTKSRVVGSDVYAVDLGTGHETQLTRLSFYYVSETYITPDGKSVIFNGDSPMRLPYTEDYKVVRNFRSIYEQKYRGNTIMTFPLDGSGINDEPTPFFIFDAGSEKPAIARDGSFWFEGRIGQGWIHYYRKSPDGRLTELSYETMGQSGKGNSIIVLRDMAVTPDGSKLVILNQDQDTREYYLGLLESKTTVHTNLKIPATAENIRVQ